MCQNLQQGDEYQSMCAPHPSLCCGYLGALDRPGQKEDAASFFVRAVSIELTQYLSGTETRVQTLPWASSGQVTTR